MKIKRQDSKFGIFAAIKINNYVWHRGGGVGLYCL
jgi:hypothetical protein